MISLSFANVKETTYRAMMVRYWRSFLPVIAYVISDRIMLDKETHVA